MSDFSPLVIALSSGISAVIGLMAAALWGILRKKAVAHVKVSSPESRDIKRLEATARRHAFLIQAGADRQTLQTQGTIMLANAVKTGDQAQVVKALERITAGESQYLAALQARAINDEQATISEAE